MLVVHLIVLDIYILPVNKKNQIIISTSLLKDGSYTVSTNSGCKYIYSFKDQASEEKYDNLTHPVSSPSIPFKPTLLFGILGSNKVSGQKNTVKNIMKPVKFNLEFDIGVIFRGLRKADVV